MFLRGSFRMPAKVQKASRVTARNVEIEGAKEATIRVLISKADGAENFVMRMFEIEAGGHTPLHSHPHEHEVFVLEGDGLFVCEGREHVIAGEHVVFVPGGMKHQFRNAGGSVLRFLCMVPAAATG
jgi:quercetin dioxygenase-like cupin family protein